MCTARTAIRVSALINPTLQTQLFPVASLQSRLWDGKIVESSLSTWNREASIVFIKPTGFIVLGSPLDSWIYFSLWFRILRERICLKCKGNTSKYYKTQYLFNYTPSALTNMNFDSLGSWIQSFSRIIWRALAIVLKMWYSWDIYKGASDSHIPLPRSSNKLARVISHLP